MLPSNSGLLKNGIKITSKPTKTYKMNLDDSTVRGYIDGQEAIKQAVYKILSTERYRYFIYSANYGVELERLIGKPMSYVCPEVGRRIREALLWDTRIVDVTDFKFETPKKNVLHVTFTVKTIFGELEGEKDIDV